MCQKNHCPGHFRTSVENKNNHQPAILNKNGHQQPINATKNFLTWSILMGGDVNNISAKLALIWYSSKIREGFRTSSLGMDTQHLILKYAPRTLLHTKPRGEDRVWGCVWNTGVLSRPGAASVRGGSVLEYWAFSISLNQISDCFLILCQDFNLSLLARTQGSKKGEVENWEGN